MQVRAPGNGRGLFEYVPVEDGRPGRRRRALRGRGAIGWAGSGQRGDHTEGEGGGVPRRPRLPAAVVAGRLGPVGPVADPRITRRSTAVCCAALATPAASISIATAS